MKLLVLGGTGMLGHRLFDYLIDRHETKATLRKDLGTYSNYTHYDSDNAFPKVDVRDFDRVASVIGPYGPDAIVNCTGITNKGAAARDPILNIEVNALFPHRLARLCAEQQRKLVHLSTDCVFNGQKGNYSEQEQGDAGDLYGRTKLLGEVGGRHCVTIRTSMIGLELKDRHGLIEWFLAQRGAVNGYQKAVFSGFTTLELSRVIEKILMSELELPGLLHVAAEPITKFDLLTMLKEELKLKIEIVPDIDFECNRSLNANSFKQLFHYAPPAWEDMIRELGEQIKRERL